MQKLIFNRVNKEKLIRDSKNEQINAKEKTYIFILDMENKQDDCFFLQKPVSHTVLFPNASK